MKKSIIFIISLFLIFLSINLFLDNKKETDFKEFNNVFNRNNLSLKIDTKEHEKFHFQDEIFKIKSPYSKTYNIYINENNKVCPVNGIEYQVNNCARDICYNKFNKYGYYVYCEKNKKHIKLKFKNKKIQIIGMAFFEKKIDKYRLLHPFSGSLNLEKFKIHQSFDFLKFIYLNQTSTQNKAEYFNFFFILNGDIKENIFQYKEEPKTIKHINYYFNTQSKQVCPVNGEKHSKINCPKMFCYNKIKNKKLSIECSKIESFEYNPKQNHIKNIANEKIMKTLFNNKDILFNFKKPEKIKKINKLIFFEKKGIMESSFVDKKWINEYISYKSENKTKYFSLTNFYSDFIFELINIECISYNKIILYKNKIENPYAYDNICAFDNKNINLINISHRQLDSNESYGMPIDINYKNEEERIEAIIEPLKIYNNEAIFDKERNYIFLNTQATEIQ
jgi:hypothetical protein